MVGSAVGGIQDQVADGTGILLPDPPTCPRSATQCGRCSTTQNSPVDWARPRGTRSRPLRRRPASAPVRGAVRHAACGRTSAGQLVRCRIGSLSDRWADRDGHRVSPNTGCGVCARAGGSRSARHGVRPDLTPARPARHVPNRMWNPQTVGAISHRRPIPPTQQRRGANQTADRARDRFGDLPGRGQPAAVPERAPDGEAATAARPASIRATGTRNGEQEM